MKQRDALEIFSFKNYYGAQVTTVLLNASNSVKYAVKTASIVKQHKRVETLLERDSINDLATAEGRLIHLPKERNQVSFNHSNVCGVYFLTCACCNVSPHLSDTALCHFIKSFY